jgi:peptide/nickel transport system permease protein
VSTVALGIDAPAAARASLGYWRAVAWRLGRDPTTLAAGALLLAIILSAVFASVLAPYDPNAGSLLKRLAPIGSPGHLLGTDEQGRDMLTRLLYGGRMTLLAGITPVAVAFVVGTVLGVLAGFVGGALNQVIMRTMDIFYAFPAVLLAIAISGALGPGLPNTLISLCVVFTPRVTRVAESATVQVKSLEFIAAARASGASIWPILRHHLLANVLGPAICSRDNPRPSRHRPAPGQDGCAGSASVSVAAVRASSAERSRPLLEKQSCRLRISNRLEARRTLVPLHVCSHGRDRISPSPGPRCKRGKSRCGPAAYLARGFRHRSSRHRRRPGELLAACQSPLPRLPAGASWPSRKARL